MRRLVEFEIAEGETILVEVDEPEEGSLVQAAKPGEMIVQAQISFSEALDKMKPAINLVIQKLKGITDRPDEIAVEFGLKVGAQAGVVLAAAGIEANYKVTLKWVKK